MDNSRFSIIEAVKNAHLFVGREWAYLLKAALLPVLLQAGTSLFVYFQRPAASEIESYLWGFPATVLFAWFVFIEMRLLLLGERLDRLPKENAYLVDRRRAMQASVLTGLLFYMGMAAGTSAFLNMAHDDSFGVDWMLTSAGMMVLSLIFWGLRFGVVPVLASVLHPVRPFLRQVEGFMFSLRLLSMGLLCLIPPAILMQGAVVMLVGRVEDPSALPELTDLQKGMIIVISAPLSMLVTALLNASVAEALKQIIGRRRTA
jgi:hypothetical protein